jgi:hypothetical protein
MMSAPITMSLMGGLGNQLFQFATGLEVASRAGTTLQLDLAWFDQSLRRAQDGLILRPYELDGVADDIPKVDSAPGRVHEVLRHGRDVVVRRTGRLINRLPVPYRAETGADFNPAVLASRPGTHLWGYFASWRYFPTVADSVRRRILDSPKLSEWATEAAAEAQDQGAIALHVRRGDYLTLVSTYGHVSADYYARGLDTLRRLGHEGPVWLFSDEPAGARNFLDGVHVDRVIEPPGETTSLDSMVAMSGAQALVIANSTYSWWAAFLRQDERRPVIAPRPMWASRSMPAPRDVLLPRWLTVDSRSFG